MPRWKRILIVLVAFFAIGGVYAWLFGVQTACAVIARYKFRSIPEVKMTPAPLQDQSISNQPHVKASYFGYQFELPWDDIDEEKSKTVGKIRVTAFRSGNAFWFSVSPPREFVDVVMKGTKLDSGSFQKFFGIEASQSDYGFMRAMLGTTPEAISPFVSRQEAAARMELLLLKAITTPKAESGIFSIQTPSFRGSQFESPQNRPFKIVDDLFAEDGKLEIMFLQKVDGSASSITQPEINRVLQSVRKIPANNSASLLNSPETQAVHAALKRNSRVQ